MDLPELKQLDLSGGQIKVYEALLDLGTSGIQPIQEKSGLERRAIYDILNKLIEKGFVTYTEERQGRKYQLTHPKTLKVEIKKRQEELKKLNKKIPQLTELFTFNKPPIGAEVYRGNEAVKKLFEEALEYKATYWMGGNSGVEETSTKGMKHWFKQWDKRRVEKKRFMYDLVDHGTHLEDYPPCDIKKHKKNFYKYHQLPKHLVSPVVLIMFGNKVAQVLWKKQSFAFVLESKEVHDSFMKYFSYFWEDPW